MTLSRKNFLRGAVVGIARPSFAQEKPKLKLFMNCDMEGSSGIFTREQAWYWENGVREQVALDARELFTADINSASAAALEAGATELIVCDTHHGGGNLIKEKILTDARIRYLFRSVGIEDGSGDGCRGWMTLSREFCSPDITQRQSTPNSFLPHAWNFEWLDFTING